MTTPFVHLHVHSEYSLVDSTLRLPEYINFCAQQEMPAAAITDMTNMFALVKFYKSTIKQGIKPIAGADVWISQTDDPRPSRATILSQNHAGYLNLSKLVSRAWLEGHHSTYPLIEANWMTPEATQGIVILLGFKSTLARLVQSRGMDAAIAALTPLKELFPDRLYLEMTRTDRDGEEAWNQAALALADKCQLPVIASNDVVFFEREDYAAHEARVCINQGRVLADPKRPREYSPEQYLKTGEEMAALFADVPEALENTLELAKRLTLDIELGIYHLPQFPVPDGHDLDSFIRERAEQGLEKRLEDHELANNHTRKDYDDRLEHELSTIINMGFPGYFLIVSDFIQWAKDHDIPVGPGRGSGAGSLVAWALKITDLDPLRFDLLFERFLNPERVSMPDFDVDFCMDKRDQVIDYVARKYGRDHVSQIITYGSMAAKAVLRDCGRVLSMPYGQVDKIAKLIPARPLDLTLQDALGLSKKAKKEPERIVKEFCQLRDQDQEARTLIELALKLEGITRNAGKHAGGVVIAPSPLTDFSPLYSEPDGDSIVTQYDKGDVEEVGLVKFDFLGLRTLTIIDWAVKAINQRLQEEKKNSLDITQIPLDDRAVFKLLKQAQTVAVFQLESGGMQRMLKDAKPDRFEDIIALVALYRPGPMDLIPSFIKRKHGQEQVTYPDPRVEPVLSETHGIMVYQEQVMQMAQIVGGYTLGGADLLRRAMGKKKVEEMVKHRQIFAEGAAKNGLTQQQADAIFDLMEKFAGYGFNKSHAAAYALVSYQTAWLKAHYPAEFMAATLSSDMDNTDKVVTFLQEVKALGLELLPPDVNHSQWMFKATSATSIRYGLGAIKGVGHGVCDAIAEEHQRHGAYADLADFCLRVSASGLNRRTLDALIRAGAMDSLATNRASLTAHLPHALKAAEQQHHDQDTGQTDMFGASNQQGQSRIHLDLVDEPAWPVETRLQGEYDTLGHYLSGHPTDPWKKLMQQVSTCPLIEIEARYQPPARAKQDDGETHRYRRPAETPWSVAGMLVAMRKRGEKAAFVRLEDADSAIEVSLFGDTLAEYSHLLEPRAMLLVEGGLGIDNFSGQLQLRGKRVLTFADAYTALARQISITLADVDASIIADLQQALKPWVGGQTRIHLHRYHNQKAQANLVLGDAWQVKANRQLLSQIEQIPGVEKACVTWAHL